MNDLERWLGDAFRRAADELIVSELDPLAVRRAATQGHTSRNLLRPNLLLTAASVAVVAGIAVTVAAVQSDGEHRHQPPSGLGSATPIGTSAVASVRPTVVAGHDTCDVAELTVSYRAGGLGTGNDFGSLNIVNDGPTSCTLPSATLTVTPLDASGHAIATAASWQASVHLAGVVLSGHGTVPADGHVSPAGDRWAQLLIGGDYRDDPSATDGLCPAKAVVTPAAWRVSGYLTATVKNLDLTRPTDSPSRPNALSACADSKLQLTSLTLVQRP